MRQKLRRRRRRARRDTPGVRFNRAMTELVHGPMPGRPTFSTRAGTAISCETGMRRRTGKAVFHGGVGVGAMALARRFGASNEAAAFIGLLAFLGLESYDPS